MRDFIRWFDCILATALSSPRTGAAALSGLSEPAEINRQIWATTIGLAFIAVMAVMDVITPAGMSLDFFYLLGSAFVGWAAGGRAAIFTALVSGAFLCWHGSQIPVSSPTWVSYWNSALRLVAFAATGWLAAEVGRLTRRLERTVQERTTLLRGEAEEHKETAVQLRKTLELFRQVTENITEVFWVTDTSKSRVNYVSRGFEKIWGQPRQAVYSSPAVWLAGVHPEDRDRISEATYTKQITGEYDEEYRVVRPDGSLCWVHDRAFPVRNEESEVYRIVGITEDITQRRRADRLLQAQRDVGVTLSLTSDLTAALDRLLETATQLEGIDCGAVYLVNSDTGTLDLEAHVGLPSSFVDQVTRYGADAADVRLVKEGRALYPICGPLWNKQGGIWSGGNIRSLAVVPLQHKDEVLGALSLGSQVRTEIPAETRVVIEIIAAQAAGAITRIRLERQILEISDREQARVGQDIHDDLCQQLIGMAFTANSLEQSLRPKLLPEAATAKKLCVLLDATITEARRVCRGLYPVRLETEGLVPALEEFAHSITERFKVACDCEADNCHLECDVTTATHLYRIAQEAVNNALKHSGGDTILIWLSQSDAGIDLQITDNGSGIREAREYRGGMGLQIMDYRARTIGGALRIQGDQTGTVVSCRVPARD
ncbi:MAG TPA: PAS domain-containing protein [Clostridia bacterium]|nr:PAS domain-containing protein [Clostridia bacterium]